MGISNPSLVVDLRISGNTAGATSLISTGTAVLIGGSNITLSQAGQSISFIGASGGGTGSGGFELDIAGNTDGVTSAISSGTLSLVGGSNITLSQDAQTITINAANQTTIGIAITAGNTAGATSSLAGGYVSFYGGNSITLSQSASSITIIGPTIATSGFTLNGTTGSASISAGAGIGIGQANSTITISASVQTVSQSLSVSGNTTGATSSGTYVNVLAFSGMGIASVGAGNGTVSISVTTPSVTNFSTVSLTALGNTTVSATGSFNNLLNISGAGGVSIGAGAGSLTISGAVPINYSTWTLTALGNTTSSSSGNVTNLLNISGAGIASVGVGAGSITISVTTPSVTNFSTISLTALGNTTSASAGTFNNLLNFSGAGIASVGVGAGGTVTISVPAPAAATNFSLNGSSSSVSLVAGSNIGFASNLSTITISGSNQVQNFGISSSTAGGVTQGTTTVATGPILLVAGSNITLSSSAGAITIVAPAPSAAAVSVSATSIAGGSITDGANAAFTTLGIFAGQNIGISQNGQSLTFSAAGGAAGTQSLSAGANSVTGTAVSLALVAGNNISLATATAAGALTVTVSNLLQQTSKISFTQNVPLQAAGLLSSKSGTLTGTAGFGSSLFLQRVYVPQLINLSEIDLAIGLSFNATSNGAGTISRSMVVYSFGNSTSLASVMSASGTSAWITGTSTAGTSVSLTQHQGGWAGTNIQPMTFASSALVGGDYVIGNIVNFAQASSTWSLSLYGQNAAAMSSQQVVSNVTTATLGAMSSGGLAAVSAHTGTTSAGVMSSSAVAAASGITAFGIQLSSQAGNVFWEASYASSSASSFKTSVTVFTMLQRNQVTLLSTLAGSIFTATASAGVLTSGGLSAGSFIGTSGSLGAVTTVGVTTSGVSLVSVSTLPAFGFIGTGSTTSAFPFWFSAGIMSTGAVPVAITLTSTAVTYLGSIALAQPWWALAGA